MMIEQHYDEEVLIGLLDEPKPDAHLVACETCKTALNSIRQVTSALHEETVWDRRELSEEPKPETRSNLRVFASNVAAEDAAAERWVKALLAKSSTEWRAIVDAHPEWRTAGFVRGLVAEVDAINFTAPTDAVELTKIAVDVAETLGGNAKVKAVAWKEYSYALHYVGAYQAALTAITRCDQYLAVCMVSDYDSANAKLVRASICAALERLDEALALTRSAVDIFRAFGSSQRLVVAEITQAMMLTRMRRYSDALPIYYDIMGRERVDELTRACAFSNAAVCCRELSQLSDAKGLFIQAIDAYDRLRVPAMRAKTRWSFGSIMVYERKYDDAIRIFHEVRAEFAELGLSHDVALIAVDTAEALLMAGRHQEVSALCREAIAYFEASDLTYTQGALTALAYLREAVETKALTIRDVNDVRAFFEMLPKQPELLFARPA